MQITHPEKIKEYYQALVVRASSYNGIFFVGVKTTSIFCIATCRARKPKFENVVFYSEFKDALDQGFRPCKVCKPTENALQAPAQVTQAIELVKQNLKDKITDYRLKEQGIAPEFVRRWFNKHYGMTFQSFQRMYRINQAMIELKEGKSTTETAFDSGYESLSGFGYTYKKLIGKKPEDATKTEPILISRLTTPIGPMFVCATEKGVCLLEFVDRRMLETEFKDLQKRLNAQIIAGENKHILQAKSQIEEYFLGQRQIFDLKLHTLGTEFQNEVWQCLIELPYGETASYRAQAETIGRPNAVRAVATANGYNRIAIVIPCHRIIGKDGSLVGYGGGLERKRWLLAHEAKFSLS